MTSERCEGALNALKSYEMPFVISAVIHANTKDHDKGEEEQRDSISLSFLEIHPNVTSLLHVMNDSYADALMVIMYAGRDEFVDEHPYDEFAIDTQFREWWDFIRMDNEYHAREQMASKWPLGEYLRKGAYMFHIDMERN